MCGGPLVPGTRFCGQCGAAIAIPSSVSNAPASSGAPTPNNSPNGAGRRPILVVSAGAGNFVWAAITLYVALCQLGLAVTSERAELAALGLWNGLLVFLYIGIGISILLNKKWAWTWGIGSNTLNLVVAVYQLTQGPVLVNFFLIPIELFIIIALYVTRTPRAKPSQQGTAPSR